MTFNIERVDLHKNVEHSCRGFGIYSWDVYIGWSQFYNGKRLPNSLYQNPYSWKIYGRDIATGMFRENTALTLDLTELVVVNKKYGRLPLGCWYAPNESCHGDVLIEKIEERLTSEEIRS